MAKNKKQKKPTLDTYKVSYEVVATASAALRASTLREIIEQHCEGDQKVCIDNNYGGISYHEAEDGNITPDYEDSSDEWGYYPSEVVIKSLEIVTDKIERRMQSEPFVSRMEVYHPLSYELDDSYCYTIKVGSNTVRIWAEPKQHTRTEIEGSGLNSRVVNNIIDSISDGDFELKHQHKGIPNPSEDTDQKNQIKKLYNGIL